MTTRTTEIEKSVYTPLFPPHQFVFIFITQKQISPPRQTLIFLKISEYSRTREELRNWGAWLGCEKVQRLISNLLLTSLTQYVNTRIPQLSQFIQEKEKCQEQWTCCWHLQLYLGPCHPGGLQPPVQLLIELIGTEWEVKREKGRRRSTLSIYILSDCTHYRYIIQWIHSYIFYILPIQ